jgi:arylsulfatase A-like enzyme
MKKKLSNRPNILWISFEDTYPFYGCYGDTVARTPHLDKLAEAGQRYTKAFSTAAVCAPARSAVITGMYAISTGAQHMRTAHVNPHCNAIPTPYEAVPPAHVKCLPEYLRAAGYYCTNNKKTDYQFNPPFTAWDDCSLQGHWRNRPEPDQPFFAVFNLEATHESGHWEDSDVTVTFDPEDIQVPPYLPDTPKVRTALCRMYSHIENNDHLLGNLLKQLDEDGLTEDTIIMHWSDHGPLPRGKRWPYDSGIRVPLIVKSPDHTRPGSVSNELISTIDLAPTVLSLCGVDIPTHLQGHAFMGPKQEKPREYIFASRDRHDTSYDRVRAVRDSRYKYLRNYHPLTCKTPWIIYLNRSPIMQEMWRLHMSGELTPEQNQLFEQPRRTEELYDTEIDPHELNNLIDLPEFEPVLERLRESCDQWLTEVGDLSEIPETEMVRRWWPDGEQPQTSTPLLIGLSETCYGMEPLPSDSSIDSPAMLHLECATEGASIGYQLDADSEDHWQLYTHPIRLKPGTHQIRAQAIRIGYTPSSLCEISLQVKSPAEISRD